ncbi:MAG: DEAD/DEAH box helicase [Actinobacteria bacterium]|nr:DEAD/DEAH box helicase [Actinomycetota bacterium]
MTSPTAFAALGVPPQVDAGLAAAGFSAPFAIQTEAIPVALTGVDLCGRARTGSGKTLAFGVPMLSRIDAAAGPRAPRGLVQVEWVLRKVTSPHQTMLFSATLDGQVGNLVRRYMNDPREVSIDAPTATVGTMRHLFLAVHRMDKDRVVAAVADGAGKTVVFCDTKRLCDKVAESLQKLKVKASALHGDMSQAAREKSLAKFADGTLNVLVATDVAARGIDIDDVAAVVHYEPPIDVKTYLHRSGRTARAGRDGWAVTLAEYNQHTTCRIIQRGLRLEPQPPIEVFSNDKRLADLSLFLAPATA